MGCMKRARIRHFWELMWGMTEKELRARYKHTVFGFVWLIANPFLQMLVIGFVFPLFVKNPVQNYNFFLFAGLLAWNFFSLSLSKVTPAIVNERHLVKKSAFPRSVIPLSIILSNLINYLVAFAIFLVPLLFLGTVTVSSLGIFVSGLLLLIAFITGLGLLTSALDVRFRDINFFVQAALIIWFYATPIVYSLSQMPHTLRFLWRFNPLTAPVLLMQRGLVRSDMPDAKLIGVNASIIMATVLAGIIIFSRESRNFDDWL